MIQWGKNPYPRPLLATVLPYVATQLHGEAGGNNDYGEISELTQKVANSIRMIIYLS